MEVSGLPTLRRVEDARCKNFPRTVVDLLQYLAPGFVVAWVFYGFSPHVKPPQFERVVQALVLTVVVQVLIRAERWLLEQL